MRIKKNAFATGRRQQGPSKGSVQLNHTYRGEKKQLAIPQMGLLASFLTLKSVGLITSDPCKQEKSSRIPMIIDQGQRDHYPAKKILASSHAALPWSRPSFTVSVSAISMSYSRFDEQRLGPLCLLHNIHIFCTCFTLSE